ncbi:MAG: cation transporter [Ruminococcaceae bacterium]|nr:cation transporter [Oscillospiraceae bacterium]
MADLPTNKRNETGRNAGIVGIAVNLLLFAAKLFAGILSGSVSIIADAMNNLTDAGSSILVLIGYVVSSKPADREHPYGHARMEYICSLFISVIVTVLGIELLRSSWNSFMAAINGGEAATYGTLALVIMIASAAVKLALAVYYRAVGQKIDSDSLRASSVDSICDVCSSAAVIVGILLTPVIGPVADGICGALIAVYILVMGIKLIREAADTLLGTSPDIELIKMIVSKIKSYDGVLGIHDLVVHTYGFDKYFASVHVEMDAARDTMESHDIIDNIEADFAQNTGVQLVIHLDPVTLNDPRVDSIHEKLHRIIDELASAYSCPISLHDFRVVFGVTHTNVIFDIAITHEFPLSNDEIVKTIREDAARSLGEEYNLVITIDRDYSTTRY